MSYTGFIFRIKLSCPDCNNAIPVNKIKDVVECPNCLTKVKLPAEWWKENILSDENLKEASNCSEGEAQTSAVIGGGMKYDFAYGKRFPRCQECKDDLKTDEKWTVEDIRQAAEEAEYIHCKKCNEPHSIRKPDAFINSVLKKPVVALIGEDKDTEGDKKYTGKPMMFACLSCGAGLKADGSDRVVECAYCNTDNFLPEDLWKRLHPVPKPKVFFMLAEY